MTDFQLKFDTLFQILVAVEAFSTWKGKSFIGKAVANFDEGPAFDRIRFNALRSQLTDIHNVGKTIWSMVVLYFRYKIARFRFLFINTIIRILLSIAKVLHNTLGFCLRCTPLFSIPILAICYIKQIGCKEDIVSHTLQTWIYWFVLLKVICYVICATLNKIILKDVSVKPETPDVLDIESA